MNLPYTATVRPDTGLTNVKLGIWLFLASEVMLFGGVFSAYVLLRAGAATWPRGWTELSVSLGAINTIVLIASSVTMVMARASLKQKDIEQYLLFMGLTVLLGTVFLAVKAFEYGAKFEHGQFPATSMFLGVYFTLTGLHGLHVLGGVSVNSYLLVTGSSMWQREPERLTGRVEAAGLYWHFVDIVWIFLFPLLYLA